MEFATRFKITQGNMGRVGMGGINLMMVVGAGCFECLEILY